jgi:hypothetical protein
VVGRSRRADPRRLGRRQVQPRAGADRAGEAARAVFARLVADDRTEIVVRAGRLLASPVPPIEGLVERRGLGLTPEPHLAAAVLRLVIDCGTEPERMPEPEALVGTIAGVTLPRLSLLPRPGDERLILTALALFAGSD